jgi:flagellar motor switch protein FliN/FliY
MEERRNKKAAEIFSAEFASSFGDVLTEVVGSSVKFVVKEAPELSKRSDEAMNFRISVNDVEGGDCFVEIHNSDVLTIGRRIVQAPPSEHKEPYAEALQHAIAAVLLKLKAKLAQSYGDMSFTVEPVSDLVFGGMLVVPLSGVGIDSEFTLLLYFSNRFHEALFRHAADGTEFASASPLHTRNLDLVMDIELNVTLRFGQRQMSLREVLELDSGSVIELDRRVEAPVELLLDGKVIALGEAVIVDGNYGVRVTKVPQPITSHWS